MHAHVAAGRSLPSLFCRRIADRNEQMKLGRSAWAAKCVSPKWGFLVALGALAAPATPNSDGKLLVGRIVPTQPKDPSLGVDLYRHTPIHTRVTVAGKHRGGGDQAGQHHHPGHVRPQSSRRSLIPHPPHRSLFEGTPQPGHRTIASASCRAHRFQLGTCGGEVTAAGTASNARAGDTTSKSLAATDGADGRAVAATAHASTAAALRGSTGAALRGSTTPCRGSGVTRARTTSRAAPPSPAGTDGRAGTAAGRGAGFASTTGSPHSKQKSWSGTISA